MPNIYHGLSTWPPDPDSNNEHMNKKYCHFESKKSFYVNLATAFGGGSNREFPASLLVLLNRSLALLGFLEKGEARKTDAEKFHDLL